MNALRRSIAVLAAASLLAGVGVGMLCCQLMHSAPALPATDPAAAYVEKMNSRYGLDRDQRRMVWMIYSDRIEEESRYTRSQLASLPNHAREQLETIARRANQRILAVLKADQRRRFTADTADPTPK